MRSVLAIDLEQLLHQLGVGQGGVTGRSHKADDLQVDGCLLETEDLQDKEWAQVRLRFKKKTKKNLNLV